MPNERRVLFVGYLCTRRTFILLKPDVMRYDEIALSTLLGDDFRLIKTSHEDHTTPSGKVQTFNYFLLQKISQPLNLKSKLLNNTYGAIK